MNQRLPIILVAGFFGAGKSSLLHYHLGENSGGYEAVLVQTLGSLNHDAIALKGLISARRRFYDSVIPMPADMAGDSVLSWTEDTLRSLSQAARFQRVWIELSGITSLAIWARQFRVLPDQSEGLSRFGALHQAVLVVDALDLLRSLIIPANQNRPGPWLDFHHGQIEAATLLVLNKCDQVDDDAREKCRRFLRVINPEAYIVETDFGEVPEQVWERPGSQTQAAFATERRLRPEPPDLLPAGAVKVAPPELGCRVIRVWRAFHPERLWDWFNSPHAGLLRVKGIVWLATRNLLVGGVSRTVWQNGCGAAGVWWAAMAREEWPQAKDRVQEIMASWHEPYGDRRQELTLIGEESCLESVEKELLVALLTDQEEALGYKVWTKWNDPFPEWDLAES